MTVAVRRAAVWFAVLLAAVALCLFRGGLNSIWAEDGQEFLTDALTLPWHEPLATPFNGYFHTVARACFAVIALFPVAWAAPLNAATAAVLTVLLALAVFHAARERLGAGAVVVAGAAAVPMGYVPNTLAQLQFPLVYAGLWMLLWTPRRLPARVVAVAVPALALLNSILGLLLVPVALLRLARHRDRDALLRVAVLLPGAALQLVPLLLGGAPRDVGERPDLNPVSVAATYLRWAVPRSFLGDAWLAPPVQDPAGHRALVLLGLAVPVAVVAVALLLRLPGPRWRLAALLAGFGAFAGCFQLAVHGVPEGRYLVLITLPNIAAAVALTVPGDPPADRFGTVPFVALATLVAAVHIANLRPGGYTDGLPRWDATVAAARAQCQAEPRLPTVTVHTAQWPVLGWEAVLPCHRLR